MRRPEWAERLRQDHAAASDRRDHSEPIWFDSRERPRGPQVERRGAAIVPRSQHRLRVPGLRPARLPELLGQHPASLSKQSWPHALARRSPEPLPRRTHRKCSGPRTGRRRAAGIYSYGGSPRLTAGSGSIARMSKRISPLPSRVPCFGFCRALVAEPAVILADEPTGNLDPGKKLEIIDILRDYARERRATLLVATHDYDLLDAFDLVVDFRSLGS